MFVFAERARLDSDPATRTQRQIALGDAAYTLEQLYTWGRLPAENLLPTRAAEALLAAYAGAIGPLDEVLGTLPDCPPGQSAAGYCAEHPRTVDAWRNLIRGLAESLGVPWVGLGNLAIDNARQEAERLTQSLLPVLPPLSDQPLPTPDSVLPDLDVLERLTRYEAHLSREFSRILRELRQSQCTGARPPGGAAPSSSSMSAHADTLASPPVQPAGHTAPATSPHGPRTRASQACIPCSCQTNPVAPAREPSFCETNPVPPRPQSPRPLPSDRSRRHGAAPRPLPSDRSRRRARTRSRHPAAAGGGFPPTVPDTARDPPSRIQLVDADEPHAFLRCGRPQPRLKLLAEERELRILTGSR
jgi:hypothetical protein